MNEYKQVNDILKARISTLKDKIYYLIKNYKYCDLDK